jgi:hypothetical protein
MKSALTSTSPATPTPTATPIPTPSPTPMSPATQLDAAGLDAAYRLTEGFDQVLVRVNQTPILSG